MADNHYAPNPSTPAGGSLKQAMLQSEDGREALIRHRATMIQMRDGDGSDPTHYATVTARYGFDSNADAKAAFDELDSYLAKITTDASVSSVSSAATQLFSRLRA